MTVKACLQSLAEEEAADALRGVFAPHETTASSFLSAGLELQEQQCVRLYFSLPTDS